MNRVSRRGFLAGVGVAGVGSVAGCLGAAEEDGDPTALENFRGSGPLVEQRDRPGGTSLTDLPDLSGQLNVYVGGGESGIYLDLVDQFEKIYPDFTMESSVESSSKLAGVIVEENDAGTSPADLFLSIDVGSLISVVEEGAAVPLPANVTDPASADFSGDEWVGLAGRARAMPYNTNTLDESDLPTSVRDLPETDGLSDGIGWAPTYGAFQSFVTAMRLIRGERATKKWLRNVKALGTESHDEESLIVRSVADGELAAGFANHYYALRVLNSRKNPPVDIHFTSGDAGALINVSGVGILEGTGNRELAENFVRHLLSAEAQEFFATRAFAYPTVPDVAPAGGLPTIDQLNPPDVDLTELSDLQPTTDLLRDVDLL
jgi:iron(III) transport system substrate-binding protein